MNLIGKKVSLLLAVLILVFSACSDDNEESVVEIASVVVYDGESYDLKGYVEFYGKNELEGSYDLEVYLAASSLTLSESSENYFSGEGLLLYIDFNSSGDELVSGTYTYAGKFDGREASTFSGGNIYVDYSQYDKLTNAGYDEITGGTIKVTNDDGKVSMVLDLTTENSTIKGNFSSFLEEIVF